MTGPIRVVIADDQHIVRAGLRALLEAEPTIDVVGEAADGQSAIDLVERAHPDVVLMDIRMPGLDGLAATRHLRSVHPDVNVIILTTFGLDAYVFDAVRAGAAGFLLKDGDAKDLIRALHVVASGEALMAPEALRMLLDEFAATPAARPEALQRVEALTPREREVLELVASGNTNREISTALHISEATTKTHISNLLAKLASRDRVQLVITAFEAGVVPRRAASATAPRRTSHDPNHPSA